MAVQNSAIIGPMSSHFPIPGSMFNEITAAVADSYRMSPEEIDAVRSSPVAQLITVLPFIAGCKHAARTGLVHLGLYVVAQRGQVREAFDHNLEDNEDVMSRLTFGAQFVGGDKAVLDAGMARLAYVMVKGYVRDLGKDSVTGEYNPVLWGQWDADVILADLEEKSGFGRFPKLDQIFGMDVAVSAFWN